MHNLALTIILAEQRRRQCPCGAVADRPLGLCRKCQDRNAWRRKTTSPRRKVARRRLSHRARRVARFFADVFTLFAAVSIGMEG
jgi:hypothetical protein